MKEDARLAGTPVADPLASNPLAWEGVTQPRGGKGSAASSCSGVSSRPSSLRAQPKASVSNEDDRSSQISAVRSHISRSSRADDDRCSQISAVRSQISCISLDSGPSTIRSSEPSAIARNKIAELQLRLELERVQRLERENELQAARLRTLKAQAQ